MFIGTQVSNWNQERIDKRETAQLLLELKPGTATALPTSSTPPNSITRRPAPIPTRAFAGWRGDPAVSDEQFVIAAYQASQNYTLGLKGETWTSIFGGDRLRDIENADVRRGLTNLMTFNYDQIDAVGYRHSLSRDRAAVHSPMTFRTHPRILQRPAYPRSGAHGPLCQRLAILLWPKREFAAGAAALRARPELVGELRWHRAALNQS